MFEFHVEATDGGRAGLIRTAHGEAKTPAFMPVGSQGTVKGVSPDELRELGVEIVLANSYHLYLRPGVDTIEAMGGLHSFMGWDGPILTDSGGYQVMSLAAKVRLSEEGVTFRSHLDGSQHLITPEAAVEIQEALGVDMAMCLDICTSFEDGREDVEQACGLTARWAERSLAARKRPRTALFAIVQGGVFSDLRGWCARELTRMGFDGFAVGSLSTGEPKDEMYRVMAESLDMLPGDKPRYVMGVGTPEDLVEAVAMGADLFDCVLPTRNGRNGQFFTSLGKINIKNSRYADDPGPVDEGCGCYTCRSFSRAYLRHLFLAGELLGYRLATLHNLYYYINLMAGIRSAVEERRFEGFRRDFLNRLNQN